MNLRDIISDAKKTHGKPLDFFTVLSDGRDPYRLDTPANHKLGEWLQTAYREVNPNNNLVHLRGLHYMLVGRVNKPDGNLYTNTDKNWEWLQDNTAKAARWLGYLDWDLIHDARNSPPQIFAPSFTEPEWRIRVADIELYLPDNLEPRFTIIGDLYRQPFRQVVIAEKQGVESVLLPVCRQYEACLALPSGEISDSMLYGIMKDAHEDGRPLVIHQLGDFDPAGNQMAISSGRKLQAMQNSIFPDMHVIVNAIGLTLEQCEAWGLPSTPLKETEQRARKWLERMGREQTELDAAVALVPDQFAKMVEDALREYYDTNIAKEAAYKSNWLEQAANINLSRQLNDDSLRVMREQVQARLDDLESEVRALNESLNIDLSVIEPPEDIEVLIGNATGNIPPLLDTSEPWHISTQRMISRKALD